MAFKLAPVGLSDIPDIVSVALAAFQNDPIFSLMKQLCSPPDVTEYNIRSFTKAYDTPGVYFFKIVDVENGKIAAFSKWKFPHMMDALQKPTEMMKDPLPVGYNEKLLQGFVDRLAASREQHWDGNTDYSVNMLATHPLYQRKGLGKMLLEHGLGFAERDGAKTYLTSSPAGLPLYLILGWKEVGSFEVDLRAHGAEEVMVVKCLVKESQPPQMSTSLRGKASN